MAANDWVAKIAAALNTAQDDQNVSNASMLGRVDNLEENVNRMQTDILLMKSHILVLQQEAQLKPAE